MICAGPVISPSQWRNTAIVVKFKIALEAVECLTSGSYTVNRYIQSADSLDSFQTSQHIDITRDTNMKTSN